MNLYPLLITLIIVNAEVVPDTTCDGVIINGHYHEKEILTTGLDLLFRLAVDYNTNRIYFSYLFDKITYKYKSALFDLETKEYKDINDVPGGCTQTVDQNTHDMYIGGENGIYKYDHKYHKSELYAANNKNIWGVFIKDVLYFTEYPSEFMYTYIDGNIARFKDMEDTKARRFVIDTEDVMFYSNATGLFAQKKGSKYVYVYSDESVHGLTLDVHGNAYMCTSNAIYKIDKMSMSLKKVICVDNCRGLALDKDNNFIYSDGFSLVRFKRMRKTC